MNSISYVSMGTLVQITPRVGPEGVVLMKIDVASSRSGPIEDGTPISVSAAGEVLRTPAVETLSAKASVRVAAGQTIVLAEAAPKPKSAKQRLVLVTPQVLPISGR
jgi:type II secretory pathway component GspD/PulD (secretin)